MSDMKFTREHEWVMVDDDIVTVGITEYAQSQLGDIVYVELPNEGDEISLGDEVTVIESVKAAGEIKSPVNGVVVEVNEALSEEPEIVNTDPTGTGWFFKVKVDQDPDLSDLMDEDEYSAYLKDEA